VRARNSPNAAKLSPEQRTDPVTGLSEHALREELGKVFTRVCHGADAKPKPYLQVRFIGREKNGREIVRVQQSENGQSFYPVDTHLLDTQPQYQKANRPYFNFYLNSLDNLTGLNDPRRLETLGVRLSNIELNRDPELQTDKPVLRASVPVWNDDQSEFFGIIVINMDFREIATTSLSSSLSVSPVISFLFCFSIRMNWNWLFPFLFTDFAGTSHVLFACKKIGDIF